MHRRVHLLATNVGAQQRHRAGGHSNHFRSESDPSQGVKDWNDL
jgi:hypothetical protein